jgi:glycosyltransferase involved in cell wall biosynthesis
MTRSIGRLRIAQVAPLHESVPPRLYGGTERIVSYLTEELVRGGHEVTLFASGDSQTSAHLVAPCARALRLAGSVDPLPLHYLMIERLARQAADFDIIHFHVDYLHFPVSRREGWRHVTTLHGRLDLDDHVPIYEQFSEMPVVSISDAQRAPVPNLAWQRTIYHGFPRDLYRLNESAGDYLAFVGRISPEKRVDRAIEIALRAGMRIKIAAKVDRADRDYYNSKIAPLLQKAHVEFLGEIGERDKQELLCHAAALVFPIDWPEPFGMVMAEAMACGTPVIAFRRGSVPEVVDHGITGFVCDSVDDAVAAVARIPELSRARCRRVFEERFGAERMASEYVEVYRRLTRSTHDRREQAAGQGLLHPRDQHARG